jgi:YVTN family beta-propeller protein
LVAALAACGGETPAPTAPAPAGPTAPAPPTAPPSTATTPVAPPAAAPVQLRTSDFPLAGERGAVSFDFLAYDAKRKQVWIPITRDTGTVEVFDVGGHTFAHVTGFPVVKKEANGRTRTMGPSSVSLGYGVAYVGNRGNGELCVVDTGTLKRGKCVKVSVPPDGVVFVPSAKEVWVTSPGEKAIAIFDVKDPAQPRPKEVKKFEGSPEGYAVDDAHGVVYTNFEDKDRTVAVDIKSKTVRANWSPGCGSEGPRGLVVDSARELLVVACTDHVQVVDPKKDGKNLGRLDTGAGVDLLDYLPSAHRVYVASGKEGKLLVAELSDAGEVSIVASGATAERARNAVVDAQGNAYVVDPGTARLLVLSPPN